MKCEYCGKEIPTDASGFVDRRKKYCSEQCKKNARHEYMKRYHRAKYGNDDKYTNSHLEHSREWMRSYRGEMKEQMYKELIEELAACDSDEEKINLLKAKYRITRRLK